MVLARESERPHEWRNGSGYSSATLAGIGRSKLVSLCNTILLGPEHADRVLRVFDHMSHSWAAREVAPGAPWPCDITDEGAPFEFSLAFTNGIPHVRMLVESQTENIDPHSTWEAGLALNHRLEEAGLCDLSRFDQIQDIFAPVEGRNERFYLWHAAVVPERGQPLFKAYLNPRVSGPDAVHALENAFMRLGHAPSWEFLQRKLGDPLNTTLYFSLDLAEGAGARVKVYVGRSDSLDGFASLLDGADNIDSHEACTQIEALTGRRTEFRGRPLLACFAFTEGSVVPHVAMHVPIRCHVDNDAEAAQRLSSLLGLRDKATLGRALKALSPLPLHQSKGLITYISFRPRNVAGAAAVTTYLAPRIFPLSRES
jgi:tryptophan dimethylallyltransferase